MKALGPRYHSDYGIWDKGPHYLGTWPLKPHVHVYTCVYTENKRGARSPHRVGVVDPSLAGAGTDAGHESAEQLALLKAEAVAQQPLLVRLGHEVDYIGRMHPLQGHNGILALENDEESHGK